MTAQADHSGPAKEEEEKSIVEVKVEERSGRGSSPLYLYPRDDSQEHQVDEFEEDESDELEDDQNGSGAGNEGRKKKRKTKIARRKAAAKKAEKLQKKARQELKRANVKQKNKPFHMASARGRKWNRRQFWSCLGMEPLNIDIGPVLDLNTKSLQPIQAYIKSHPAYSATIKPLMSKFFTDHNPILFESVHVDLVYALCMCSSSEQTDITDDHQSVIDELSLLLNDL